MKKIFVDGAHGTTGLKIFERLKNRDDIEMIEISEEDKKDPAEKEKRYKQADLVMLCLPDDASKEAFQILKKTQAKVIDTSTAFRTDPDWVYGMPELHKDIRGKIKASKRVSNPGCYPTGFILLLAPFIQCGIVPENYPIVSYVVTGYSGGGKKMIADFESTDKSAFEEICARPKNLNLQHKHLPEMKKYTGLRQYPHFVPIVGNFYNGLLVFIPLFPAELRKKCTPDDLREILSEYYEDERFIKIISKEDTEKIGDGFISPTACNETNNLEIFVTGHEEQILLAARLDNLGKGASGAAVQNMNLMLGFDEAAGLVKF